MLKSTSNLLRPLGLTRPTVVIDEPRARANIRRMAAKARTSNVVFRPHFKTHQCAEIGQWFADEGISEITVSSLEMAQYFAGHGWTDITLAFLLNPVALPQIRDLARDLEARGGRLGVTIDSAAAARTLAACDSFPARVWIKIDTGYGRTGVGWNEPEELAAVVHGLGPHHLPAGLLTHTGNTYAARAPQRVIGLHEDAVARLHHARADLTAAGAGPDLLLSLGDTPSCSLVSRFRGIDEIRPGNFVFNDLMQWEIGSCESSDLAAAVACPVVGLYPQRRQIVIHGGAVHLSKESLLRDDGVRVFGLLGTGSPGKPLATGAILRQAPVTSLSQEHGIVTLAADNYESMTAGLEIGDVVLVWPIHSCLTCDLHQEFLNLDGRRIER
jgi:D-serine deaminase-like pyridoxal phosphate-dependent protein